MDNPYKPHGFCALSDSQKTAFPGRRQHSPVAWRHVLLGGHYTLRDGPAIDLDAIIGRLDLR